MYPMRAWVFFQQSHGPGLLEVSLKQVSFWTTWAIGAQGSTRWAQGLVLWAVASNDCIEAAFGAFLRAKWKGTKRRRGTSHRILSGLQPKSNLVALDISALLPLASWPFWFMMIFTYFYDSVWNWRMVTMVLNGCQVQCAVREVQEDSHAGHGFVRWCNMW